MKNKNSNENLTYSPITDKDNTVIGRLEGPCADFISSTRNGRKYSESLWEKVFNDPIVKESFEMGGIPGELGHPLDNREEIDMEKIAIMLREPPQKDSKGQLIAKFDILPTPNGKILKCLCDYGYKIGISSRGSGDTYTDENDDEIVDEDTYNFTCFDAVLVPSVKAARMNYITESLSKSGDLKNALNEALNESTPENKQVMIETLTNLNIPFNSDNSDVNIDADSTPIEAVNDGSVIVEDLQKALKEKKTLEDKIMELQEKLSVSYAKEAAQEDKIQTYKQAVNSLSASAQKCKAFESKISVLEEELCKKDNHIAKQKNVILKLQESKIKHVSESNVLSESLKGKTQEINKLKNTVHSLNEKIELINNENVVKQDALNESISNLKRDAALAKEEYRTKLTKTNGLIEKYKRIANTSVNKYIESQAIRLGLNPITIRNKLDESYTFDDIDRVCKDLKEYAINISKLPIDISNINNSKVTITESKEPILQRTNVEDEIDPQLMMLAGLQ